MQILQRRQKCSGQKIAMVSFRLLVIGYTTYILFITEIGMFHLAPNK